MNKKKCRPCLWYTTKTLVHPFKYPVISTIHAGHVFGTRKFASLLMNPIAVSCSSCEAYCCSGFTPLPPPPPPPTPPVPKACDCQHNTTHKLEIDIKGTNGTYIKAISNIETIKDKNLPWWTSNWRRRLYPGLDQG